MVTSFAHVLVAAGLLVPACSSNASNAVDAMPGPPDAPIDASDLVTFSYTPSWSGVQAVEVIGAFGQASDWTAPLVTLAPNGLTFTGSVHLPAGQYPYVLHVVGDADAGAQAATLSRYVFDPASAGFVACPPESPTYSAANPNPCSVASLAPPAPQMHVRGRVVADGAPVAGYLVLLEREEADSHHFFADRMTTASDGAYDMLAAAGSYRIQVQHPQYEAKTDAQLAPVTLPTVRRTISSSFAVAADVAVSDAEVAFHDYAKFAPRTTAKLPATFAFGTAAQPAHLEVYGTARQGVGNEIGDPWFSGPATQTGSAVFDGTFNTTKASETTAAIGERYFWGIERKSAADTSGLSWTAQSLVVPITFQ
jgi:carboxypeptidase family protein